MVCLPARYGEVLVTIVLNRYAERTHGVDGHVNIGLGYLLALYLNVKLADQRRNHEKSREELAGDCTFNPHGAWLQPRRKYFDRRIAVLVHIFYARSELFKGLHKVRNRTLVETPLSAYCFDAGNNCGKRQDKADGCTGEVRVLMVLAFLYRAYIGCDGKGTRLPRNVFGSKHIIFESAAYAQFPQARYHRVRIVGNERVVDDDGAFCESGEKERPVGIAFRARNGDCRRYRLAERS